MGGATARRRRVTPRDDEADARMPRRFRRSRTGDDQLEPVKPLGSPRRQIRSGRRRPTWKSSLRCVPSMDRTRESRARSSRSTSLTEGLACHLSSRAGSSNRFNEGPSPWDRGSVSGWPRRPSRSEPITERSGSSLDTVVARVSGFACRHDLTDATPIGSSPVVLLACPRAEPPGARTARI